VPLHGDGVDWWGMPLLVSARIELYVTWGAIGPRRDADRFERVGCGGPPFTIHG